MVVNTAAGNQRARRAGAIVNTTIQVLAALWIVFQANVWGFQQSWRHDLNRDRRYAVTSQARQLLAQLDERDLTVEVILPFRQTQSLDGRVTSEILWRGHRLCREFEQVNPRFRIGKVIDVARDPAEWQQLKDAYQIESENRLYLIANGKREALEADDLAKIRRPPPGSAAEPLHVVSENVGEAITAALERLVLEDRPVAGFTQGSGELPFSQSGGENTCAQFALGLRDRGLELRGVDLGREPRIPDETRLLIVVAGGEREFQPLGAEARLAVEQFLAGGGSLLLFAGFSGRTGLEETLAGHGIQLGDGIVIAEGRNLQGRTVPTADLLATAFADEHPICKQFTYGEFRPLLRAFRPLVTATPAVSLVSSDAVAWLERDVRVPHRDPLDPPGPFPLVVASEKPARAGSSPDRSTSRIVAFGSWTPVLDRNFRLSPDTRQLLYNSVSWLTHREFLSADVGRDVRADRVDLTDDRLLSALFWCSIVLMPTLPVLLGLAVFVWRRRAR